MKKFFTAFLIVVVCLSLTACGGVSLPDRITQEADETQTTRALIVPPSEAAVRNAFEKALEVYGWFDLCSLECDSSDFVERGDHRYCRVLSDEVPTYDALRTLVYDLFDTATGDHMLAEDSEYPPYIGVDGLLYGQDAARGADITKGEYTLTVEQESGTSVLCKAHVETLELDDDYEDYRRVVGWEDFVYHYQYVGGRWVFTDFSLFY